MPLSAGLIAPASRKELLFYWLADFDSLQLIVDSNFSYPYFANNVFLIRTDRYREASEGLKTRLTVHLQILACDGPSLTLAGRRAQQVLHPH